MDKGVIKIEKTIDFKWSDFCYKSTKHGIYIWDLDKTREAFAKIGINVSFEKDI